MSQSSLFKRTANFAASLQRYYTERGPQIELAICPGKHVLEQKAKEGTMFPYILHADKMFFLCLKERAKTVWFYGFPLLSRHISLSFGRRLTEMWRCRSSISEYRDWCIVGSEASKSCLATLVGCGQAKICTLCDALTVNDVRP
jgi:hypothetical protein